eukprot:g10192.t1
MAPTPPMMHSAHPPGASRTLRSWHNSANACESVVAGLVSSSNYVGQHDTHGGGRAAARATPERYAQFHISLQAVHLFWQEHGHLPIILDRDQADEVVRLADELVETGKQVPKGFSSQPESVDTALCHRVASISRVSVPAVSFQLAGLAATVVSHYLREHHSVRLAQGRTLKTNEEERISRKGAVNQWMFVDELDSGLSGTDPAGDAGSTNELHEKRIVVDTPSLEAWLGPDLCESVASARIAVIGCGRLGRDVVRIGVHQGQTIVLTLVRHATKVFIPDGSVIPGRASVLRDLVAGQAGPGGFRVSAFEGGAQDTDAETDLWEGVDAVILCVGRGGAAARGSTGAEQGGCESLVRFVSYKCVLHSKPLVWGWAGGAGEGGAGVEAVATTAPGSECRAGAGGCREREQGHGNILWAEWEKVAGTNTGQDTERSQSVVSKMDQSVLNLWRKAVSPNSHGEEGRGASRRTLGEPGRSCAAASRPRDALKIEGLQALSIREGSEEVNSTMGRKKVVPAAEPSFADEDGSGGGLDLEQEDSGRGLLIAVNKHVVNEDEDGEGDEDEDDDGSNSNGSKKLNKPMMSAVVEFVDEGLGDDFEDTPWVPPTVKRVGYWEAGQAEDNRAQNIYRAGKSSIWDTRLHELEDMGIGVSLYFQFLKVSILNSLMLTMIGNVGSACVEDAISTEFSSGCNSTVEASQEVFGTEYSELDVSYYITAFELLSSVFAILAIIFWRWRTNVTVEKVDSNKITATDYAVYIEGLPKTAERKEIGQFFSDLYQLESPDWKGRGAYEVAQPVFNVENTEDKWYMGKWVAEVCVARKVGREVKAYKDKKDTVLELKRKRAEAKMYNEGTPLEEGVGADPAKFKNAVKVADKLGERIARTTDKIMEMRQDIDGKQACVGAYIVFNHPLSLHRCMEDFSAVTMFKYPKELKFQQIHKLKVVKAPEPDNIIWENLEFSKFKRRMRQSITGLISFVLLLIAFGLILAASGLQDNFSQIVPKIAYCQLEVPALYLSNYSRAIDLADELSLVRPDQSYREGYDKQCEELLDNPLAVYMVYTLAQGDESYKYPVLNYSMDACGLSDDVCPAAGDELHCPCVIGGSIDRCSTLECSQAGNETCDDSFVFSTVSGCYCSQRIQDVRAESDIFAAIDSLNVEDNDICGSFATTWVLVKVFNFIASFMTPVINGILEWCLTGLVAWQHNTSDDETATRLMYGVFQTQFINTGLLFLLVYGTAPDGYETPQVLQKLKIFSGAYSDFSRDWQVGLEKVFLDTLVAFAFLAKRRIKKAKKAVEQDKGEFVMQADLNQVFVGPEFDFTVGRELAWMFAINALSFFFYLITYWVDKAMLLRFYTRPPHREDALQRQVNNTLPWALLLHLCFTCWFMGTESLKSEVITESISQVQPYKDQIAEYEKTYGILVSRIIRTNVFPIFLLTLGVLVWCILEFLNGIFPLFVFLGKGFRCILGACTGKKRARAVIRPGKRIRSRWTSESAAYTDVYYQYIPKNGDLTTAEKLEGWMVSHLADKSVVKKKGWDMDDTEPPPGRDAKFSWEVIRDNSIFTYRIDLVPAYAEVMAALQEEERLYKEDLEADSDDSDESGDDDEDEDEEEEESDDEEEQQETKSKPKKSNKSQKKATFNPFDEIEKGGAGGGDGADEGEDGYNPFADFMAGMDDD